MPGLVSDCFRSGETEHQSRDCFPLHRGLMVPAAAVGFGLNGIADLGDH